jgi:hypothetical protein
MAQIHIPKDPPNQTAISFTSDFLLPNEQETWPPLRIRYIWRPQVK